MTPQPLMPTILRLPLLVLALSLAAHAGSPTPARIVPRLPAEPKVALFPIPLDPPLLPATVRRITDGDTLHATLTLAREGLTLDTAIRLAPTKGRFNASDVPPGRDEARARLTALLDGHRVWVQLTGEWTWDRRVGRVYRAVEGESGAVYVENVADRLIAEGYDVPRGRDVEVPATAPDQPDDPRVMP